MRVGLFLTLISLATFWQVRDCDFINLDDNIYIVKNPHIRDGLTWQGIRWAFTADLWFDSLNADYWQPVTFLSRMLDITLFGLTPSMHHLMNLAFHIANTLLLFHVLRRMTTLGGGPQAAGAVERSAWVAALFAVHPLRVESVAWVTERKDLLGGFFWLLTIWAYLRYVALPCRRRYGCMLVLFALGLMSKPVLVTLPFVLLLLDWWPLGRMQNAECRMQNCRIGAQSPEGNIRQDVPLYLFLEKLPLFALAGVSILITLCTQLEHLAHDSWRDAVNQSLVVYATYLFRTVYPVDLAVWYPHPDDALPFSHVMGAILLLGCLTAWVVCRVKRQPFLCVGWFWFLGVLAPTIGLRDVAGADRFTYLPSIGLCIMAVWGAAGILPVGRWRRQGLRIAAAFLVFIFMIASWFQVRHWRNSFTLFQRAIRVSPDNWLARTNLGVVLLQKGDVDAALAHLSQALRLSPQDAGTHVNMGVALARKGRIEEGIGHFKQAVRLQPDHAEAHNDWGTALTDLGRLDEANRHYMRALEIMPSFAMARVNLAKNFLKQEKLDEAIQQFAKAVETLPEDADAYYGLASCLVLQGKIKEAIPGFELALAINPSHVMARYHLADCRFNLGQPDVAVRHLEIALKLHPSLEDARRLLMRVRGSGKMTPSQSP